MAAPTKSPELTDTLRFARVAFTGRLAPMSRREAERVVRDARGVPVSGVSRRTSIVVVGMEGWPLLPDATVSRKLQRAEAVECPRRALEIDPLYADAHFNVAGLLDGVGCAAEASEHWAAYLKLDPDSEWARIARSRLSEDPA